MLCCPEFSGRTSEANRGSVIQPKKKAIQTLFYDITGTYFEDRKAEPVRFGYSRDHRSDRKQVVIGMVSDSGGAPVCFEVFEENTRDCATVKSKIDDPKNRFYVEEACFVGDRGMKTEANIEHLRAEGFDFIPAFHHREVLKLVEERGTTQMGVFDERNIADINVDGRRLVVYPSYRSVLQLITPHIRSFRR